MDKTYIIDIIKEEIAKYYNLDKQDLISSDKRSEVVYPRHIGMYLSRRFTIETYPRIGLEFGGRDPQTVIYACNKISKDIKSNKRLENEINEIMNNIISNLHITKDKVQECLSSLNLSINNLDKIDLTILNLKKYLVKN